MARILLIDDNPLVHSALSRLLVALGHDVIGVADGKEALAALRHEACDVVLTDLLMPELDGLEVIRTLSRERPGLPIIAMTGGSARTPGADLLQMARVLGARAVLAKPFGSAELLEAIGAATAPG